jgi:Protein of unknown function (DUF3551)
MTVITSTIIETAGISCMRHPSALRAGISQQQEESKMRKSFKLGVPAAMFVVAASVGAMSANPARAGEYCRTDMTAHMTSCGFYTMEQCKAYASGIGGDCFRDPNLANSASNTNGASNNGNRSALAYQPGGTHPAHRGRYRHAASPQ